MIVTYTGTRNGMTDAQKRQVTLALRALMDVQAITVCQHGCCVGGDVEFNAICKEIGLKTVGYFVRGPLCAGEIADENHERWGHIRRNHEMVDDSEVVIGAPPTADEQQRGGTWSTIRYGRQCKRLMLVILPDGRRA
jgi:hypothetical protein